MTRSVCSVLLFGTVLVGACAGRVEPDAPKPVPEAGAETAEPRPANPCLLEEYVEMRRIPVEQMGEHDKRRFQDLENACIDYRLAVARARERGSEHFVRPGADYRQEVLPWLAGMAIFTGGLYLFTAAR